MKAAAALAALIALALGAAACGGDEGGEDEAADSAAFTVTQPTRSGSFFGAPGAGDVELVLRGVGGAASIGAEGAEPGGSAGAVATPALAKDPELLLGPPPWPATLAGAEVLPQAYELELSSPAYDGVRQELRFEAAVVSGLPERPPASFGAAALTIASTLPADALTGTVVSAGGSTEETGTPLEGALVEIRVDGKGLATAATDSDGRFDVGPLPEAGYDIVASLPGYERDGAAVALEAGATAPLELSLVPLDGAPTVPPDGDSGASISE